MGERGWGNSREQKPQLILKHFTGKQKNKKVNKHRKENKHCYLNKNSHLNRKRIGKTKGFKQKGWVKGSGNESNKTKESKPRPDAREAREEARKEAKATPHDWNEIDGPVEQEARNFSFLVFCSGQGDGAGKTKRGGAKTSNRTIGNVLETVTLPEPPAPPNSRTLETPTKQNTETKR